MQGAHIFRVGIHPNLGTLRKLDHGLQGRSVVILERISLNSPVINLGVVTTTWFATEIINLVSIHVSRI
jgi:hypothetical protein